MQERGMIFNAEMVRAILSGSKTQTRRPIKLQPTFSDKTGFNWKDRAYGLGSCEHETNRNFAHVVCPHGKPGDRIWVRESFFEHGHYAGGGSDPEDAYFVSDRQALYPADGTARPPQRKKDDFWRSRPSIHMPRWASRILLEITSVRVERLQDISQADAIAEGMPPSHPSIDAVSRNFGYPDFSRSAFAQIWKSIYGEEDWQANPWVWVIEFKRISGE